MPPRKDISGQRFGLLTVIEFSSGGQNSKWKCRCDCGGESIVSYINLKSGNTTKCNNPIHREGNGLEDITGEKFGRLTALSVVSKLDSKGSRRTYWDCVCECGKHTEVESGNLKSGHTQSCGCFLIDSITVHGHCKNNKRLYATWRGMMARCYQEDSRSYQWYGARGISVCEDWHNVDTFISWALTHGYEDNLTLERDNVFRGYNPSNCRWIPRPQQAWNTTRSLGINNVLAIRELLEEGCTPKKIAEFYGVAYQTIISIKNKENYKDLS